MGIFNLTEEQLDAAKDLEETPHLSDICVAWRSGSKILIENAAGHQYYWDTASKNPAWKRAQR